MLSFHFRTKKLILTNIRFFTFSLNCKSFAGAEVESNDDVNKTNAVKPSADSYVPPYGYNHHPLAKAEHKMMMVGHSITARSIPAKMRDELK